eukprot:15362249-Ditylum_brightwellii.AAC.2
MVLSWLQPGPQSTGLPFGAYIVSSGAAGCVVAYVLGHIRPLYSPMVSLNPASSGIVSSS